MTCIPAGRIIARVINGDRGPFVKGQYEGAKKHVEDCICERCFQTHQRLVDACWPNVSSTA